MLKRDSPRVRSQAGNTGGQKQRHRQKRYSKKLSNHRVHSILLFDLIFRIFSGRSLSIQAGRAIGPRPHFFGRPLPFSYDSPWNNAGPLSL
jgi:hypothetical protein